jgi:hypothetical protein
VQIETVVAWVRSMMRHISWLVFASCSREGSSPLFLNVLEVLTDSDG